MSALLEVVDLDTSYGSSQVLFGVGFDIRQGETATLLGRNGMGKTTTVRAILGQASVGGGAIRFRGERIDGLPPDRIARMGLAVVPEGRQIFPNLSVRENLVAFAANRCGHAEPWTLERVYHLFPRLRERAGNMGVLERSLPRPPFWASLRHAIWGLAAPVLILGGMRLGWFTPTEAAVVAVFYGLFVGMVIHRTIKFRDLFVILREAAELSAVILMVVSLAGIFAWALSTLSVIDPITHAIVNSGLGEYGVLALLILLLMTVGMFLDGISIFLIFVPLLLPIANAYGWDPVWFGVLLTLKVALGQFTPPLAVNLMVSCRIAQVPIESTFRWVLWLLVSMFTVLVLVIVFPELALWLPRYLGY